MARASLVLLRMSWQTLGERAAVGVRSMSVGVCATLVDLGLLALLVHANVSLRIASVLALGCGVGIQFVFNKLFAFRDESRAWLRQGALFFAVEAFGFLGNLVLFDVAVRYLPAPLLVLRMAVTSLVYFGLCLPLWSLIFKQGAVAREVASS